MTGEPPHLFLFPGMGGYDPELGALGRACGDRVRTTEIVYPSWTVPFQNAAFDLEALLGLALAQISASAPNGPILLAGYSFGGILAFAAAARLHDAGRTVRFLGLLDIEARPRLDRPGGERFPMTRRQELAGFLAALRRGEGTGKLAYVLARRLVSPRWETLLRLFASLPRRRLLGKFAVYLDRDLLFWQMSPMLRQWAMLRGTLAPLHAPAFLFRTAQHDPDAPHHLGWDGLCPNLTVLSLAGKHVGMLGPSTLPELCGAFRRAVAEALAG